MPVRTVTIYEVPNSYVSSGGTVSVQNVFTMTINDDDGTLDATAGADSGTAQTFTGSFGTVSNYQFFYNDNVNINGSPETVKTFQLTIDGATRSFIMNDDDHDIVGAGVGDTVQLSTYNNYTALNYNNLPCFCAGTEIMTPTGPVLVEDLRPGDMVLTQDNGPQPIRWAGCSLRTHRDLLARPDHAPIRIGRGALGPDMPARDLYLSPQHRVLLQGWSVELAIGESEAFCPAKALIGQPGIEQMPATGDVLYYHIMFEHHEVIDSNGLQTESFLLGDTICDGMDPAYVEEINSLFPNMLSAANRPHIKPARPIMKRHEVAAMQALAA